MDVGQWGGGGTLFCIKEGRRCTVRTVFAGRYHEHTVDWDGCIRDETWPVAYTGRGTTPPASFPQGTEIIIEGLRRKPLGQPQIDAFLRDLSMTYEPALSDEDDPLTIHVKVRLRRGQRVSGLRDRPYAHTR